MQIKKSKTFKIFLVFSLCLWLALAFVHNGLAQVKNTQKLIKGGLGTTAKEAGLAISSSKADVPVLLGNFLRVLLPFMGIAFFIMMLYGGFLWMTSGGGEKVKKAQQIIVMAVIGIVVIISAYTIVSRLEDIGGKWTLQGDYGLSQSTKDRLQELFLKRSNSPDSLTDEERQEIKSIYNNLTKEEQDALTQELQKADNLRRLREAQNQGT